jgi:hypothetical protein
MERKLLLPVLFLVLLVTASNAQIQFTKEYGGQYNEDGRWMEQLPDSGYIMVGGTNTFSNGQTDFWLVRADAYGNELWTKSIGGTEFEFANMVKPTPVDNGFVICGFTNSYGAGGNDGWIVKTDVNGNTLWSRTVGDAGLQEFEAIVLTSDGGYAAIGVNYTTGTQYYDILLVKLNSAGVIQWQKNIGGQGYEIGNSIQETADHGFILSGQTYSYGHEDGDTYLVKTDSVGNVEWEKSIVNRGIQESHYVAIAPDGGYVMIADADSLDNSLGQTDIWLIKTDSNGDTLWTRTLGGNKKDGGKTVEITSDGGMILGGISRSFGLIDPNYYFIKTDSLGNIEWQNSSYGTYEHHDHGYRAIQTSDGGYAQFGYFRNASGFMNYCLVKVGPNGGVTKDIGIDEIITPYTSLCRSNNVPFVLTLTNYGATNENNIVVTVDIDNGTSVTTLQDTLTGALAFNTSRTLTFDQTYNFNTDGVYTVTAHIAHRNFDASYPNDTNIVAVNVLPPTIDPQTTSGVSCSSASLALSATASAADDSLFWYDAPVNGNMIMTGSNYTTPSLSSSESYYVQSVKGKGSKVGPADNSIGGGSTSNNGYLEFDTRLALKLISVKVVANTPGNRTIELRNSSGTVIQSKTINLPAGESRVHLDFNVPKGNDFRLGLGSGSGNLFRNTSGAAFPYSVSRTIEIYGSSSPNIDTYYYFYDWYIFVPYENCGSNRTEVQANIGTSTPTNAYDQTRCGPGSVTLTASGVSADLDWYDAPTGGTLLDPGQNFTTPSLSSTTTYYLEVAGCSPRIAVQAIISSQPAPPTAAHVTNCGPGQIVLSAVSADSVFWYDAATNGTLLGTGSSFTTPYLNTTQTYYVSAGADCPSARVPVRAVINSVAAPVTSNVTACGPVSVTLNATSADPVGWYDQLIGGNLLATTYNFVTPVLGTSTTYFAQSLGTCPSARIPVIADVTTVDPPAGNDVSRCGAGVVVLSAQSLDTVTWWTDATAGTQLSSGLTFTTPSISATTVYYAQAANNGCSSVRIPVTASVIYTPAPVASDSANCGPGTIDLAAISSDTIYWYDAPTGGNLLFTGDVFTTPSLTTTTTYYAQASLACPSPRTAVDAIISTTAADPIVQDTAVCGTSAVTLSASAVNPITWYDAPGGNVLGTGSTYTTPSITTTTTYYAVAGIPGCISNAVPLEVTVNTVPSDPTVTTASNCGPAQLSVTATAADPVSWYSAASGGTLLSSNATYTSTFNATTTVYAISSNGLCNSTAIPSTITIHTIPTINIGPAVISINSGQTVTLDPGAGFSSYLWSTTATTQTITTGIAGFYYITVTDGNGCQGADSVTINVIIGIDDPEAENVLMIYPNPTTGAFRVVVRDPSLNFEVRITDVLGKLIAFDKHHENTIYSKTFDLTNEPNGVYFISLLGTNGIVTRSVIIQ